MSFCLSNANTIGIYGFNERGKQIKKFLEEKGKSSFFIDKNAENIENKNVYTMEKLKNLNPKEAAIIISLQNAIAHKSVSKELYKMGIKQIVFLPLGRYRTCETIEMRKFYNELIDCMADMDRNLPFYSEIILEEKAKNTHGIISQDDKYTVFWMNIHNVYTLDDINCTVKENAPYYGKPILLLDYYQALFKFFEDGNHNELLEKYMTIQGYKKADGSYDKEIFAKRYELWGTYKEEINRGMEFFCSSPIRVKANSCGGFNIVDGTHRATFLCMQNMKYVPVILKTKEFLEIYSEKNLKKLTDYMKFHNINKLRTPIEHPAFYQFPCVKEKQEPSVLSAIQKYIGTADIEMLDMLDVSDYNSYFARMMSKRRRKPGNGHICTVETDEIMYGLAECINEVLHIKNVELVLEKDILMLPERTYNVVFALERWSGKNYSYRTMKFLDRMTKDILFWESSSLIADEEIKKISESTSFKEYKVIFQYYDGMEVKRIFVFSK